MNENKKSLTSQSIKGISWSVISQFVKILFQTIIGAILARLLLPEDFGLIGMVAVFSGIIGLFSELGLASAIIQKQDIKEVHLSSVFWLNVATGFLLTLVMFVSAQWIAHFYGNDRLILIARILGIGFSIQSFGIVQRTLFSKQLKFSKLFITEIIATFFSGIFTVYLAFTGIGVWSLIIQQISFGVVNVVMLWTLSDWHPRLLFKWHSTKELFKFSFNLLGFQFVNYFSRNLDNLIIGKFLGPSALGFYSKSYNLMLLPLSNISGALGQVLYPAFSVIQNDHTKVGDKYEQVTQYISTITFPMMLGLMAIAPEFIRILLGPNWENSIFPLQILCLVGMIQSIITTLGWIYLSLGRTDVFLKWSIFATSITIFSFFIGIKWGIDGVAIAYAIVTLLLIIPSFYVPFRFIELRIHTFFRNFVLTGCASLVMAGIVFTCRYFLKNILQTGDVITFISCILIGASVYLVLMWIFGRKLLKEIFGLIKQARSNQPNTEIK